MKLTPTNFNETAEIAELMRKIEGFNKDYVFSVSDEIFQRQPFFLSVLLGYKFDVNPTELEEIMKIYFLIWEYFRNNKNVQTKKVTVADFENVEFRYIEMLKYIDGESSKKGKDKLYSHDIEKVKSKPLLTAVLFRLNTRPVLIKMDEQIRGIVLIGIRSFIECFEKI